MNRSYIYQLLQAINTNGLDNSFWGLCYDPNTFREFGSQEHLELTGEFIYIYRRPGDDFITYSRLYKLPPCHYHLSLEGNEWIELFQIN